VTTAGIARGLIRGVLRPATTFAKSAEPSKASNAGGFRKAHLPHGSLESVRRTAHQHLADSCSADRHAARRCSAAPTGAVFVERPPVTY
jgi:hypothetical protein